MTATNSTNPRLRVTYPPSHLVSHPRHWTPAGFRARCLELLAAHGAGPWNGRGGCAGYDEQDELLWVEVSVPSARVADTRYDLRYDVASDLARCSCVAASHGQPCFHVGVALAYGRAAVEHDRAWRLAEPREKAWEENARAIRPSL